MIRSLDLFSGYGGITLALKDYARPIAYCEIDRYARAILASRIEEGNLPAAPIFPDVRKLRGKLELCDLITGGFPCQDLSVAGNGKGLAGERSGLFFEIIRLTKEIRPTFVFLENVPAIRTRGLEQVIEAFTKVGYDCRWTCLSASSLGAPHKRERWFLLAHTNRSNLREQQGWRTGSKGKRENGFGDISPKRSFTDSLCKGLERQRQEPGRITKKQSDTSEHGWGPSPPAVCGMDDGIAFRLDRIKAIGNGVVPIQVKTAFEKLSGLTKFN